MNHYFTVGIAINCGSLLHHKRWKSMHVQQQWMCWWEVKQEENWWVEGIGKTKTIYAERS